MHFFDTHAHVGLLFEDPHKQYRAIKEAELAGVTRIVSINNSLHDFKQEYVLLKTKKGVFHAVGVSPAEVVAPGNDWRNIIEESVKLPRVVAIGETGLDYEKQYGDKRSQIELFIAQLEMAQSLDKPVIIHNRGAGKDIFEILRDRIPPKGAVFHCYSENARYARQCLDAGLDVYFSFAGNLTYRNAQNLHETVLNIPVDRMLIETESPFMVPAKYRGKRTMPAYLPATAEFLAQMLQMNLEDLAKQLWSNSCKIFGIPEEEESA